MGTQLRIAITAATVLLLAGNVIGQQSGQGSQSSPPSRSGGAAQSGSSTRDTKSATTASLSSADEKFIKEAAEGGMAEVQLGKLAATNASNAQVKQFGQRMVDDHSKANMQLMELARQKNVTLPSDSKGKHASEYDKLSKLTGERFDKEYVHLMVDDHKKDVSEFKKASSSAKDADIRSFAMQTLPTLEQHLSTIERLSQSVSGATSTSGTSPRGTGATGTSGTGSGTGTGTGGSGSPRPGSPGPTNQGPVPGAGTSGPPDPGSPAPGGER